MFNIQINVIHEISINISSLADRRERTGDLDTLFILAKYQFFIYLFFQFKISWLATWKANDVLKENK